MYVRVFQSITILKEIKFSIFYCFRHINHAWDPSKMATKFVFFEFSILIWSKSNDLGGNRIGIKDYPHPLLYLEKVKLIIKAPPQTRCRHVSTFFDIFRHFLKKFSKKPTSRPPKKAHTNTGLPPPLNLGY